MKAPVYLIPGLYPALRVKTCKTAVPKYSRHRIHIVEMEIVKSEVIEREVGTEVVWLTGGTIRLPSFLAAALEKDFDDVTREDVDFVFRGENPLRGRLLRCEASYKDARSGRQYTHCQWSLIKPAAVR